MMKNHKEYIFSSILAMGLCLLFMSSSASAQTYEDFSLSPSSFGYPSYVRHCESVIVDVTADNDGDQTVVYSISVEEDPSPYSNWLDATGFGGYLEPYTYETGQVTLNDGNTICEAGTVVKVTGRVVFDLSSLGADTFDVELIVADTVAMPVWDTISTNCTQLVVSSHGSAGLGGIGGVNLDYVDEGVLEWRPDANVYLFDASTVVGWVSDADTVMNWASSATTIADPYSLIPIHDTSKYAYPPTHFSEYWADCFATSLYATHDSSIGLKTFWYANDDPNYSCGLIVKETKLFSLDGLPHDSLIVGEIVDWDIPADSASHDNTSGDGSDLVPFQYDLMYQQGTEYSGYNDDEEDDYGGWDETERYGVMMYLRSVAYNGSGSTSGIWNAPYGMYTAPASGGGYPFGDECDIDSLVRYHAISGQTVSDSVNTDLHMGLTYFFKYNLGAGDTLYLFSAFMTTMNNYFPTTSYRNSRLGNMAWDATIFFDVYLDPIWEECTFPGDANNDQHLDICDLTFYVDYMFGGGQYPIFPEQADVDSNCALDISDLTYYVNYMFGGGPAPMPCHFCPNL